MDGILVVNKPTNYTSRDIVNIISKVYHTKKVGHTGTLDPLATGVLVVCIGKCTKFVDLITSYNKEYIATIKFGIDTDTGDITGSIINENPNIPSIENIKKVIDEFPKEYNQTVPKYSAVKINGKKLYEYARNNIDIELPKRLVKINTLEIISFENDLLVIKTNVSKGTYIRALIQDICGKLNASGTMKDLKRTKQGDYFIDQANTLEDIKTNNAEIMPLEKLLAKYEVKEVEENNKKIIFNGGLIEKKFNDEFCLFKYHNQNIALYKTYEKDKNLAKPYIMLNK